MSASSFLFRAPMLVASLCSLPFISFPPPPPHTHPFHASSLSSLSEPSCICSQPSPATPHSPTWPFSHLSVSSPSYPASSSTPPILRFMLSLILPHPPSRPFAVSAPCPFCPPCRPLCSSPLLPPLYPSAHRYPSSTPIASPCPASLRSPPPIP